MTLQYPLYSVSISSVNTTTTKKSTKTISGVNLPEFTQGSTSAIAGDLQTFAQLAIAVQGNRNYSGVALVSKQEVA